MRETGVISRIEGGRMDVRMDVARPEVCQKCRACEVFGQGKDMILRVPAAEGCGTGDRVAVDIPEVSPWTAIVLVLGLPIVVLAVGLLVGSRWSWWVDLLGLDADMAGAALGVPLGVAAFLVARLVERRKGRRIIVTRLPPE